MALFRRLFYRKPPDGLLEISERVYVFDCCFTIDAWGKDDYKGYIGDINSQLRDQYPDASILVFNFHEESKPSQISSILTEYDMTIMDYPRHYEGCPLLSMEMIHHFLRSSESWLSLGQQNVLLMHCDRGSWPVLAFMLAGLLIYRKQYTGEQKTLDMVYRQAPRELLHFLSPLNPLPCQLRYLQYISRRNVASEWPPLDRALTLDCIIIRMIPDFDGNGGCCPIFRIYGKDPSLSGDETSKALFSTPKKSRTLRHYRQVECELVKIDINCQIQGDVVIECINLHDDLRSEKMMFRVMFNTAFIRSNILMLNRDEIGMLWDSKDQFPKDFRAEVLFSEIDAAASFLPVNLSCFEEKDGLPIEAFAKVQEMFNSVDWLVPKVDAALGLLQQAHISDVIEEPVGSDFYHEMEDISLLHKYIQKTEDKEAVTTSDNDKDISSNLALKKTSISSPTQCLNEKQIVSSSIHFSTVKDNTVSTVDDARSSFNTSGPPLSTVRPLASLPITPPPPPPPIPPTMTSSLLSPLLPAKPPSFMLPSSMVPLSDNDTTRITEIDTLATPLILSSQNNQSTISEPPCFPVTGIGSSASTENVVTIGQSPPPPPIPPLKQNSVCRVEAPSPPPPPGRKENAEGAKVSTAPPHRPPPDGKEKAEGAKVSPGSPPPPRLGQKEKAETAKVSPAPLLPPPPPPGQKEKAERAKVLPAPPPPPLPGQKEKTERAKVSPAPPPPPPLAPNFSNNNLSSLKNVQPIPSAPPPNSSLTSGNGTSNISASPSPPPPSFPPASAKGRSLSRTLTPKDHQIKKLKPLHWLKLTRAVQGSLWADAQKSGEVSKTPEIDISELESLFSAAIPSSDQQRSKGSKSSASLGNKPEKVQLIEHRRAYNCEIMLSKVKIPLPVLMSSLLALEDSALDVDQVDNLIKFCPTKEEMEMLKGYKGEKEKLGKCEQFFLELMQVPRVEAKLRVFSFKIQFKSQVSDLRNSLSIVNSASDQIKNSSKLKRIMQTILSLGNALNQGTARGAAVGFKLDSLLKLTDTRARNNKMTLMHYLCKVLADKLPELLDFSKDLSSLEPASKIQLKVLAEEMQAISKGLEKVVQELSMSENDGPVSVHFCKALKEFLSYAEGEVRNLAMLYSGVGRNVDALIIYFGEDPSRCPFEQVVSTLFNFVRTFNRAHEENCQQLEFERRKAEKEAANEKLKTEVSKEDTKVLTHRLD